LPFQWKCRFFSTPSCEKGDAFHQQDQQGIFDSVAPVLLDYLVIAFNGPEFTGVWARGVGQDTRAREEGRVVVSITTSAELRAAIEKHFEKRFGVEVEPVVGRAANVIRKMIEESKGGVRYAAVHVAPRIS
jgi:hypothetical protein